MGATARRRSASQRGEPANSLSGSSSRLGATPYGGSHVSDLGLRVATLGLAVPPRLELRLAEVCHRRLMYYCSLFDPPCGENAKRNQELVCQGRLATEHDAFVVRPAVVLEEVQLELVESGVEQRAHRAGAEDLVSRAHQDENAGRQQQVDRPTQERDLLASSSAEFLIEVRAEIYERERVARESTSCHQTALVPLSGSGSSLGSRISSIVRDASPCSIFGFASALLVASTAHFVRTRKRSIASM
jgi:hypothetical protein